jgi:hypothetical protein
MKPDKKVRQIIDITWMSYINKVATGLFEPENEKMMQLQLAQTIQSLIPVFEYNESEKIQVFLEKPVTINRIPDRRVIDIVILYKNEDIKRYYPIEIKCFRINTRDGSGKRRGAQNLGMYDYWMDIENIEQYTQLPDFGFGTQLTITDDSYYTDTKHLGQQVSVYSTYRNRAIVKGVLQQPVANRLGKIELLGTYGMNKWQDIGDFSFIRHEF